MMMEFGKIIAEGMVGREITLRADNFKVFFMHGGDQAFSGAKRTINVFCGINKNASLFSKRGNEFATPALIDEAPGKFPKKETNTDCKAIRKAIPVGVIEQVEPVKNKHNGNPYMQGFVCGIILPIIFYIIYRKMSNTKPSKQTKNILVGKK